MFLQTQNKPTGSLESAFPREPRRRARGRASDSPPQHLLEEKESHQDCQAQGNTGTELPLKPPPLNFQGRETEAGVDRTLPRGVFCCTQSVTISDWKSPQLFI